MSKKLNLLQYDISEMRSFFANVGEDSFRADQMMHWIYRRYCDDFRLMTNFSRSLRRRIGSISQIIPPRIQEEKVSLDGTIKWRLISSSKDTFETVCIRDKGRITLCISSQIGMFCEVSILLCFKQKI
ncbi:hypothetical protein [Candidatus Riesia pediculischaeffi]|nr:hypothetical protein [Candidatus Riesia pediculischaeffi]